MMTSCVIATAAASTSSAHRLRAVTVDRARRDGRRRRRRAVGAPRAAAASHHITPWLERTLDARVSHTDAMGGSQWAQFARYDLVDGRRVFVKTSTSGDCSMFRGERAGLEALRATGAFVVPKVYGSGPVPEGGEGCFIAMEFLDFGGRGDQGAFGEALAAMHAAPPSHDEARNGAFGFEVNNTIGETRQPNPWTMNWVEFWRDQRLMHQVKLARDPTLSALTEKVVDKRLDDMFSACGTITPSLLHGDLWSGNIGTVGGKPSVFDPAVYYGHHEADFGMSWCAGFNGAFREAYHAKIPKAPGFEERAEMYKLYHILNHHNMFGGGYYGECVSILKALS
jgi:protein-ribulosamine 3-kinase